MSKTNYAKSRRNLSNKEKRAAWEREKGNNRSPLEFPSETCNGKRNRKKND